PRSSFPTSALPVGREFQFAPSSRLEFENESSWISRSHSANSTPDKRMESHWLDILRAQIRERRDPWVVLEGRHAVEAAIAGWWEVAGVVAGEESPGEPPVWSGLEFLRRGRGELEEIAGYPFHRGVLGLAKLPGETGEVAKFLRELDGDALVVVCPRLADAANAGAIVRNAAALGAAGALFGAEGVSP